VLSGAIARFSEENRLETPIHDLAAIALAHHGTLASKVESHA